MFKKILVCTDGSASALEATRIGADLARRLGAEVVVLNVFPDFYADAAYLGAWTLTAHQASLDRNAKAREEAIEKSAQPHFERTGVSCRFMQERGQPVQGILHVAAREKVDLIVIGSRGLSGLTELFLGSVSDGVLHHAVCPVLIVQGGNAPSGTGEFRNILLASDSSASADNALTTAVQLARTFATSLTVLNVFETYPDLIYQPANAIGGMEIVSDFHPEDYASHLLEMVTQQTSIAAKEAGVSSFVYQEHGHPGKSIVRFAVKHNSDLIVMGHRGLGGFKEMLLGSVSNYVAHHAECPILII